MSHRTQRQLANRRRIEGVIGLAAPLLDVLLYAGDRLSRVAGRNDIDPEPPRLGRRSSPHAARRPDGRAGAARLALSPPWPLPDNPQQQLDWEARHRMRAALAAAIAAIGILAGQIIEQAVIAGAPTLPLLDGLQKLAAPGSVLEQKAGQVAVAQFLDDNALGMIGSRVVTAIGYFALAYAVTFLAAATRARRPQFARWAFYLPIVGAVLFGVAWIAWGFGRIADARELLDSPGTIADVQDIGDTGHQPRQRGAARPGRAGAHRRHGARVAQRDARRPADPLHGRARHGRRGAAGDPVRRRHPARARGLARRPDRAVPGPPPRRRPARLAHRPRGAVAVRPRQAAEARKAEQDADAEPPAEPAAEPQRERVPAGAHPATSKRKRKRRS